MEEEYLGDGLYASFDGWQFCLRAPRENGDHVVYLDPNLPDAFKRYCKAVERRMAEHHYGRAVDQPENLP